MAFFSDFIVDDSGYQRPVVGADVYLLNADGSLAPATSPNPTLTDGFGAYTFTAPDNVYTVEARQGGVTIARGTVTIGDPPQYVGAAGPADNTYTNYAALLASDPSRKSARLVPQAGETEAAGNFAYINGAWARQAADGVAYKRPTAGSVETTVAAVVKQGGILPVEFGITFDGSDESAKLQAMVDAGAQYKTPILLHGGNIGIGSPIDLRGRYVDIRGAGENATVLLATGVMPYMLRADDVEDVIVSPLKISSLRIDGAKKAVVGISIAHRHYSKLESLTIQSFTDACLREKDTWNNKRELLSVYDAPTGIDLVGSNHASHWNRIGIANCPGVHLSIGGSGSAVDGNLALTFTSIDIEYGTGKGVVIAPRAVVNFIGCYIGEGIEKPVFENAGHVYLLGGLFNWGATAVASFVRPLGGKFMVRGAQVGAQGFGSAETLIDLTDAEVTSGNYGKVSFVDTLAGIAPFTGSLRGDVLDYLPGTAYAPRYGQDFAAVVDGGTSTVSSSDSGSSRTMTITNAGSSTTAMRCALSGGWKKGSRVFYALVYQSTKNVVVKLAQAPFGAGYILGVIPASTVTRTAIFVANTPDAGTYPNIELTLQGLATGDTLTVHKQSFGDFAFLNPGAGAFGNLGMIA